MKYIQNIQNSIINLPHISTLKGMEYVRTDPSSGGIKFNLDTASLTFKLDKNEDVLIGYYKLFFVKCIVFYIPRKFRQLQDICIY